MATLMGLGLVRGGVARIGFRTVIAIVWAMMMFSFQAWGAVGTTTQLAFSASSVGVGTPITLTASVSDLADYPVSGQVKFCDATAKFCQGQAVLGSAQLTHDGSASSGSASIKLRLGAGSHLIKAVYAGTAQVSSSSSAGQTVTVTGGAPSSTGLSVSGKTGAYTLKATVTGSGSAALTGMFSFLDMTGNLVLGTRAPSGAKINNKFNGIGTSATGGGPFATVAGDFNQDGIPDIATANLYANTISVFLGNGDGTFAAPSTLPTGNSPIAIVTGDFNNDGFLDLAVANENDFTVGVYLGSGGGAFTFAGAVAAGSIPNSIVVGDFNRDGNLDMAVTDRGTAQVTILLGNGQGSFTPSALTPATGSFPYGIASADFNGDGIADLVIANYYSNTANVLLGKGDGSFSAGLTLNTGVFPSAVVTGDFNGDGNADVAVANEFSQTVSVFLGDGKGDLTAVSTLPVTDQTPDAITVGDFNGDGILDLAVTSTNSNTLDIFYGKGNGTFATEVALPTPANPNQMVAIDLNGDGAEDIFLVAPGANLGEAFLNASSIVASATISGVNVQGGPGQLLAAQYSSDAHYANSLSTNVAVAGVPVSTTSSISIGAASVAVGEEVQVNALVQNSSYGIVRASGMVTLFDGSTQIAQMPVAFGGVAYFNPGFTAVGQHVLKVVYSGDSNFVGSTSSTATLSVVTANTSTTTLTTSASSVAHGTIIALTATVASGGKPVAHGTVNFCKTTAAYCEDGAILRSVQLTPAGTAAVKLALPLGTNSIKAVFAGTGEVKGSSSAVVSVTVTGTYPVSVVLTDSGTAGKYSFNATATGQGGLSPANVGPVLSLIDATNHNLVLGATSGSPQAFSFAPAKTAAGVGTGPYPVVSGDFNGDGKMDVVIGDSTSGALSVLLGNGDGTFTSKASSIALGQPIGMITGDFNGDGKLDVASLDDLHDQVQILLGNGDGTFTLKTSISTGSAPEAMVVGDFNSDGIQDFALTTYGGAKVMIFLGKGDGTFTLNPDLPSGVFDPEGIVVADFNGDGKLDLVATNGTSNVTILLGNGDGTFTPAAFQPSLTGIADQLAAGDFNGDGLPDLAVVTDSVFSGGGTQVQILLNQGNGTFGQAGSIAIGNGSTNLVVADLNGDGHADVVLTDFNAGTVEIGYGYGDGYLWSASRALNAGFLGWVAVGDFDQDGAPDLCVTEYQSNAGVILLNRIINTATFSSISVPGSGAHQVEVTVPADASYTAATSNPITVSGTPIPAEIAVIPSPSSIVAPGQSVNIIVKVFSEDNYAPTGTASLFEGSTLLQTSALNNGQFSFATKLATAGTYQFSATYNGDANLAAASSLVTPVYAAGTASVTKLGLSATQVTLGNSVTLTATITNSSNLAVFPGVVNFCDASAAQCVNSAYLGTAELSSKGIAAIKLTPGIGAHTIKAVFLGTKSVLPGSSSASTVTVTGLQTTTTKLTSSGSAGSYSLTAAVTGNGVQPVTGQVSFIATSTNTTLGQATLSGSATSFALAAPTTIGLGQSPYGITTGDFNNDGKMDAAVIGAGTNTVTILLGNGNGTFAAKVPINLAIQPSVIAVGDFNEDGKLDLAIGGYSETTLVILLGNGDGTFAVHSPTTIKGGPYSIGLGDFNHDGHLDMFIANFNSANLQILLGDGTGNFTVSTISWNAGSEPLGVAIADFNGDGNLDSAVTDLTGGVHILLGDGAGGFSQSQILLPVGDSPGGIVAGDFNRDGKTDLAITSINLEEVFVLLGNGDGTFTPGTPISIGFFPYNIAAVDMNLDGKLDLVVAADGTNEVATLIGNGTGGFTAQQLALPAGTFVFGLGVADFNRDGKPDIFLGNELGNNALLLLNATTTTATAQLSGVKVSGTASETLGAKYAGNTNYAASTSNTVTLTP